MPPRTRQYDQYVRVIETPVEEDDFHIEMHRRVVKEDMDKSSTKITVKSPTLGLLMSSCRMTPVTYNEKVSGGGPFKFLRDWKNPEKAAQIFGSSLSVWDSANYIETFGRNPGLNVMQDWMSQLFFYLQGLDTGVTINVPTLLSRQQMTGLMEEACVIARNLFCCLEEVKIVAETKQKASSVSIHDLIRNTSRGSEASVPSVQSSDPSVGETLVLDPPERYQIRRG